MILIKNKSETQSEGHNMKTAVITGAASGLGKAIAMKYARENWQIIVADIQDEAGKAVVDEINQLGAKAYYYHCDISRVADFEALADFTETTTGACHFLANNAGIASTGSLMETDEAEWERMISLDLMSCIRGSKAFIPLLMKSATAQEPTAIVNTASFAGIALMPGMMSYNVTKAGVIAFSETLRAELFQHNIHVGVACPSFFKTNLTDSMTSADDATIARVTRWMENSGVTADTVAEDIFNAVRDGEFLILTHKETKKFYKMSRWFPKFMQKKKNTIKSIGTTKN
ncbi:MAG TPA: SDR family NAD(P)-dependent oxidoreductase [Aeromonadales bacterium]|nr:SDR family NAD(P)-dependent oxidoreductase [Aeromonadales bacterium]